MIFILEEAELILSLDVIYHLVENSVFNAHLEQLFSTSLKYVIIYSSNTDDNAGFNVHVKHRRFTDYIEANYRNWGLVKYIPNKYPYNRDTEEGSFADFYIFEKTDSDA
ncbi:MAG: hypothetical protein HC831_16995 [Chloroflexia bacterium]|nr:hypothetical protein [Chloroflexia bacterium]